MSEEDAVSVSDLNADVDEVENEPRLPAYEHGSPNKFYNKQISVIFSQQKLTMRLF